jgi:hypothetical protein
MLTSLEDFVGKFKKKLLYTSHLKMLAIPRIQGRHKGDIGMTPMTCVIFGKEPKWS